MKDQFDQQSVRTQLQNSRIWPNKSLSQNFLVDQEILQKIILNADLQKDELVLEVGAGLGILTWELAKRVKKVLAVEYDQQILPMLKENLKSLNNVKILQADIMKFPIQELLKNFGSEEVRKYKIVANLPYHLTSHFLKKFLSSDFPPNSFSLLLQKEVALRICAKPGDMSLLSISVQMFGQPEIGVFVPKQAFWPQPKVDSAILNIKRRIKPLGNEFTRFQVFKFAKIAFSAKRKTLVNALSGGLHETPNKIRAYLNTLGLSPMIRAQELNLDQWFSLARLLNTKKG
ncbi:MAG: 16S rRNA (adenine(1518)-N(6)/adenine(1519)-N(6))-dimethyltransferase RsmA [Patescibacteria group bacterium]